MCTQAHTQAHTYTQARTHTRMRTYRHARTHIYTGTYIHACAHIHAGAHMHTGVPGDGGRLQEICRAEEEVAPALEGSTHTLFSGAHGLRGHSAPSGDIQAPDATLPPTSPAPLSPTCSYGKSEAQERPGIGTAGLVVTAHRPLNTHVSTPERTSYARGFTLLRKQRASWGGGGNGQCAGPGNRCLLPPALDFVFFFF